MRVLLTGAGGFTGQHLAPLVAPRAEAVYGITRGHPVPDGVTALPCDLADAAAVVAAVEASGPDCVIHLASRTPARHPDDADADRRTADPLATRHLLEALRQRRPHARVVIVSSSAVYGHVPEAELPIAETAPMRPATAYGAGKAAVEELAVRYATEHGMAIIRVRPFNLVGPGEPAGAVTSALAAQVAAIAAKKAPPVVRLRHRVTRRDLTDVRDAVRAYWALAEHGTAGEVYNVCSGVPVGVGDVLQELMVLAGVQAAVEETAAGPGPGDILVQAGDPRKLKAAVGWAPEIPLEGSLRDLLARF
jgi:GDP-4-dehydro-6-deoxy-D-mannose reductase